MRKLIPLMACILLAGCDYTVPLVKSPELKIDPEPVGLWQRTKQDGQVESLLVIPSSKTEYMVSLPAGSKNAMFARACLCRSGDLTLVQLEWFGTATGTVPDDNKVFQYATFSVAGDTMTIRMLNTDLVKGTVKTSSELAKALRTNRDKSDCFHNEMVFRRVKK